MTKEKKRKEPPADAAPSPGDDGERRKNKEMTDPIRPSQIKNKDKRSELHAKLKREKKDQKRKDAREREQAARRAAELGEEVPEKRVPWTIENTREPDETVPAQ